MSPSRSSIASREPVEAPEGTAARPIVPLSSSTSHSTVGLPRLSRISLPTISTMALIRGLQVLNSAGKIVLEQRLRLDHAVDRGELLEQGAHVLQRHRVRAVAHR